MSNNTPTCPACGAKFAHSPTLNKCTRCGLPDEIISLGPQGIARWKKDMARIEAERAGKSKKERKQEKWGSRARKMHKRKHGRPV